MKTAVSMDLITISPQVPLCSFACVDWLTVLANIASNPNPLCRKQALVHSCHQSSHLRHMQLLVPTVQTSLSCALLEATRHLIPIVILARRANVASGEQIYQHCMDVPTVAYIVSKCRCLEIGGYAWAYRSVLI